jgi:hypothetical protein
MPHEENESGFVALGEPKNQAENVLPENVMADAVMSGGTEEATPRVEFPACEPARPASDARCAGTLNRQGLAPLAPLAGVPLSKRSAWLTADSSSSS